MIHREHEIQEFAKALHAALCASNLPHPNNNWDAIGEELRNVYLAEAEQVATVIAAQINAS